MYDLLFFYFSKQFDQTLQVNPALNMGNITRLCIPAEVAHVKLKFVVYTIANIKIFAKK